jgi:class 3 adenylate cyclase
MPVVLGWLGSAALLLAYTTKRNQEERQAIMQLFSRYVSPKVAREIWQHREVFLTGGRPRPQRLTATVLFADIEDVTPISERLDAQEVMKWANVYLNALIEAVVAHDGVVVRFTSDGIFAAFGVPVARQTEAEINADATRAVDCALTINRKLLCLNDASRARGWPPVTMRIGIYTGSLVGGSRGNVDRMEYAIIGDTVKTAERLQYYSRDFPKLTDVDSPCRIAVGDATWKRLNKGYSGFWVGEVFLKGKQRKVEVHQLIDDAAETQV